MQASEAAAESLTIEVATFTVQNISHKSDSYVRTSTSQSETQNN
jgi:hypothetical protein